MSPRLVLVLALAAVPSTATAAWYAGDAGVWGYRKQISLDRAQLQDAGSATLLQFPLLISTTDPDLGNGIGSGGRVAHPAGYDIVFTDADELTPLAHEVESYASATGQLIAWVNLPSITPGLPRTFYVYFGNPAISSPQQRGDQVWDPGFVGVWHLAEPAWAGVPGEVIDSTGRNHGTKQADAGVSATGKIGGCGAFGPSNDNVRVAPDAGLLPGSITVSAWVNAASVGSPPDRHPYVAFQDSWRAPGSNPRGYYLEIYRTQTDPRPTFYTGNGAGYAHAFASTLVANGTWYHLTGTRDALTGVTRIYVNGVQEGTAVMDGGIAYLPANPLLIGGTGSETWNGRVDELRVSSVARPASWIRTEYYNQSSPGTFSSLGVLEVYQSPPVDAGRDAGADGGSDAGADGGSDAGADADAGAAADAGVGYLNVGCGCRQTDLGGLWLAAASALLGVRRRRRHCRPSSPAAFLP